MKTGIIIASFFTFYGLQEAIAQPEPITIQFVEAQPKWEHLIWDTSFNVIVNQPDHNKYTTVHPHQSFRFNNDIFISSRCFNYNLEIYGYILEKLDIHTGEIKWQSYSTYYNNGLQDHYRNLYLRPDGDLEMIGIKRHGPYLGYNIGYWNTGGGKSNFIRKIFDYDSGELLRSVIGKDSLSGFIPQYLHMFPVKFDSTYLAVKVSGEYVNDDINFGYYFYKLNAQHDLEEPSPISTIFYETMDSVDNFTFGQPQYTQRLDDTLFVGLIFQEKFEPEKTKAQLIWFSTKNLNEIKVEKLMNIENLIPRGERSFRYLTFKVVNNAIYITQPYKDPTTGQYTTYLICLDTDGNLLHYIPHLVGDNHIYNYINLVYASEEYDYFTGGPSKIGRQGFDILKLNRGVDTFQYISSLTSAIEDEQFTRQLEVTQLYDDGLFIIGAYTKKLGAEQNAAVKYYCFNGADLGMSISTSTSNPVSIDKVNAFPNPTEGVVNFVFENEFSGVINLFGSLGNYLISSSVHNSFTHKINLGDFPPGIYYAAILDNATLMEIVKIIRIPSNP